MKYIQIVAQPLPAATHLQNFLIIPMKLRPRESLAPHVPSCQPLAITNLLLCLYGFNNICPLVPDNFHDVLKVHPGLSRYRNCLPPCVYTTVYILPWTLHFVNPVIRPGTFGVFPPLGYCAQCCREHLCTNTWLGSCFQFLGGHIPRRGTAGPDTDVCFESH